MSAADLVVSVRADATETVPPDAAVWTASITVTRPRRPDALREAAVALNALTASLEGIGGTASTAETGRAPLTWSARSATTAPEEGPDERTGVWRPTGRIVARVPLVLVCRDMGLLTDVGDVFANAPDLDVHGTDWVVDRDNPAWRRVRATAVTEAVEKARDHAGALGATVVAIEHLADTGLLGTGGGPQDGRLAVARVATLSAGPGATPTLDPVAQEVTAVVEARFRATGASVERPGSGRHAS